MNTQRLSFSRESLVLLLILPDSEIHPQLEKYSHLRERNYCPKQEFHITIIGSRNGAKIKESISHLDPETQDELINRIEMIMSKINWKEYSLLDIACKVSKDYSHDDEIDKRESIIQIANVNEMKKFYDELNLILGIKLDYPFEHVTLMTRGFGKRFQIGIGIESESDFYKMNRVWLE